MKRRTLLLISLGLMLLAAVVTTGCSRQPRSTAARVVIVVVEALRHDYPDRVAMPNFDRLVQGGGRAERVVPVFPTNSTPNMAAIDTGTTPAKNGMINNIFFLDPERIDEFDGDPAAFRRAQVVEPIWVTAVRQGVPAAAINWPASEVPFAGTAASRRSQIDEDGDDDDRVAELNDWLMEDGDDAPRLMLIYLDQLDDVSHEFGPDAAETLHAVERVDRHIGRIVQTIKRSGGFERTTLFVVSDHGMAEVDRCIHLEAFLRNQGFDAATLSSGATSNVYLDRDTDPLDVQRALTVPDAQYDVYLPEELPERYRYVFPGRVGDLVMVARAGTYFRDRGGEDGPVTPAPIPGMHGFVPDNPDMAGALAAWGRGVPSGQRWGAVSVLDVYPTVCRLLGLEPGTDFDGTALPAVDPPPPDVTPQG